MVLAYAALLLQLSAPVHPALTSPATTPATSANSLSSNPQPANSTVASSIAPDGETTDNRAGKPVVDPTPSFRSVRLGEPPTGNSMDSAATKDVALDVDQMGQGLSNIRVPEIKQPQNNPIKEVEPPSRKSWLALAVAEHAAASFDAYSTRQAISRGAVEDDPLMRPFAHSDAIYAAAQAGPFLFDYIARRMQRSDNLTLRRFWWLPQSVSTGVSLFAGVHNLHVANSITK